MNLHKQRERKDRDTCRFLGSC